MHLNSGKFICAGKGDPGEMHPNGKFEKRVAAESLGRFPGRMSRRRWAVILAGGDGIRLRGLTRFISGDDRPKQFCRILGERTLLGDARERAERSVQPDRVLYTVTRAHQNYYSRELADRAPQRIVQPYNKGTAPAILSSLLHIWQIDRDATVAVMPCDHSYSDEGAFTSALESAFAVVEETRPESVALTGVQPKGPEVEYGWIEVGGKLSFQADVFQVTGFHEKPPLPMAELLFQTGCLWNTFVMVGRASAFLKMAAEAVPGLLKALRSIHVSPDSDAETRIPDWVYDQIEPIDFSRQVLTPAARQLVTVRLPDVGWNDLGNPERVLSVLEEKNELPIWAVRWRAKRGERQSASRASA